MSDDGGWLQRGHLLAISLSMARKEKELVGCAVRGVVVQIADAIEERSPSIRRCVLQAESGGYLVGSRFNIPTRINV